MATIINGALFLLYPGLGHVALGLEAV